jgi:NTE family protein
MPRRIDGPSRLLAQVTSALTNNLMQARLAEAGADGRCVLEPGADADTARGPVRHRGHAYLVDAGRRAAEAICRQIRALLHRAPQLAVA